MQAPKRVVARYDAGEDAPAGARAVAARAGRGRRAPPARRAGAGRARRARSRLPPAAARCATGCWSAGCMRSTLHLVDVEDLGVAAPAVRAAAGHGERAPAAPARRQRPRRRRSRRSIADACRRRRAEIAERARPVDGPGASPHLLARAAIAGPHRDDPGPGLRPAGAAGERADRETALDELARRYYAAHAGATRDDLAYWSGLPQRDCRPAGRRRRRRRPGPRRELPAYDELLLGWRDRSPTVPAELASRSTRAAGSSAPSSSRTASGRHLDLARGQAHRVAAMDARASTPS